MTRNVQSDCRLSGNGRQQETLARAAPGRPCRCSRHRHNMADKASKPRSSPSRPRFASTSCGTAEGEPLHPHRHSTPGPRRSTPRFPPSRLVQRLPTCAVAHSRGCRQGQASNNPEQTRTVLPENSRGRVQPRDAHYKTVSVDRSAHFASTTSSIPISGTLPSNDSECLASSRGT
jgi:hypothetical protein